MFPPEMGKRWLNSLCKISYASIMRPMEFLNVHMIALQGIFYFSWSLHISKEREACRHILHLKSSDRESPCGSVAETPRSQRRGLGFEPWSGNWIPHATTKSLHAATKDRRKILRATTKTLQSQINI